jgi:hypothetical protein
VEQIKNQLDTLDEITREIIILKVWENFKFKEITEIVGQDLGSIKMKYYRGLEKIKLQLGKKDKKLYSIGLPALALGIYEISKAKEFAASAQFVATLASKLQIGSSLFINNITMLESIKAFIATTTGKVAVAAASTAVVVTGTAGTAVIVNNINKNVQVSEESQVEVTPQAPTVTPTAQSNDSSEPEVEAQPVEIAEFPDWETYVLGSEYGYKFKYPQDWDIVAETPWLDIFNKTGESCTVYIQNMTSARNTIVINLISPEDGPFCWSYGYFYENTQRSITSVEPELIAEVSKWSVPEGEYGSGEAWEGDYFEYVIISDLDLSVGMLFDPRVDYAAEDIFDLIVASIETF